MAEDRGANQDGDLGGKPIVVGDSGVARTATPAEEKRIEEGDGVVPDPTQATADRLWTVKTWALCACLFLLILTLCGMVFMPKDPPASADAAIIVAVIGVVLAALLQGFNRRQN
jgi:hypothetical protein